MKYSTQVKLEKLRLALGIGANFEKDKLVMRLTDVHGKEVSGFGYEPAVLKVKWDGEVLACEPIRFVARGGQWTAQIARVADETLGLPLFSIPLDEFLRPITLTDDNTLTVELPLGFFTLKELNAN